MAVIVLILAALVGKISPERTQSFSLLGLAYFPLLMINILFMLYWIVSRKKTFVFSLIAILLGYENLLSTVALNFSNPVDPSESDIVVMSFNTKVFGVYGNNDPGSTRDAMLQLIKESDPDILCLQEYYSRDDDEFNMTKRIKNDMGYPYYHFGETTYLDKRKQHFGVITFSKFPIIRKDKLTFSNSQNNNCIISDIKLNDDTVRVFNAHLQSIHLGKEVIIHPERADPELNENVTLQDSKIAIKKLRDAYIKRAPQARAVARNIQESPYAEIVCTDLNDNPGSYAYQTIAHSMRDAFIEKGIGMGGTYAGPIPGLRIDHILVGEEIDVLDFEIIPEKISDHYPIVARLGLQD